MIGGRLNGNTVAVRMRDTCPNTRPISAVAPSDALVRWPNGFSRTNTKPAFGSCTVSRNE